MKTTDHLSDTEIQQYALGGGNRDEAGTTHISHWPECSAQVALYRKMAHGMSAIPMEAFDFDLAATVLTQLPSRKRRSAPELVFFTCVSAAGILAATGLFCYLNAGLLNELFWHSKLVVYCALCCLPFAFLVINLWNDHSGQIRRLDAMEGLQHFPGAAV